MAKSSKTNWTRLSASPQLPSGTDGVFTAIDLSAYVDPLRSKAFKIVEAKMILMSNDVPYGVLDSSAVAAHYTSIGMQIATGTQTTILRPSDGKVIYHLFGKTVSDADSDHHMQTIEWKVEDIWPDGYVAVVDTLTVSAQSESSLGANFRYAWTLSGYQEKVSANQLASLLVAQTA